MTHLVVNMFLKLRKRFNNKRHADQGIVKQSSSIFRGTKDSKEIPGVEPALTFTLSQDADDDHDDENEAILTIKQSPKFKQISSYVFTEQELMANELNHMRKIQDKQAEIVKLLQVNDELTNRLASKQAELEETQEELEFTEKELAEVYQELSETDSLLGETKLELADTKDRLNVVTGALMQLQHQVHEKASMLWPW